MIPEDPDEELTSDVFDFLERLPNKTLERLYRHPPTCLAVFRYGDES